MKVLPKTKSSDSIVIFISFIIKHQAEFMQSLASTKEPIRRSHCATMRKFVLAAFFLVGSRAVDVQGSDVETQQSKFMQHSSVPQSENGGGPLAKAVYQWIAGTSAFLAAVIIIAHMFPALGGGGGGGRNVENFNYRIPPSWNPDTASHYSFRAFMTDISL